MIQDDIIRFKKIRRRASLLFISALATLAATVCIAGQSPAAQPTPDEVLYKGYRVTSATEFGWRWRSLDGSENKYRSDLNYKQGFRTFDTNLLFQSESGKGKYFDSLLISNSGWGADPTGFTRVNMEKTGAYKFSSNVRRVKYFNNLLNFANPVNTANPLLQAPSQHAYNTARTFGDFDFTLAPQNEKIRFNFGVSFGNAKGPGVWTVRANGDEFPISALNKNNAVDYRVGAEGKLWGFDWGLTQGFRIYRDRLSYRLETSHPGNNTTNQSALVTYTREYPVDGRGYFTNFNLHRMFADRFEFTGRLIYSSTSTRSSLIERMTGRDNTNPAGNIIILDQVAVSGGAKRPQTRGDVGITYNATENFRISNTLTFDQFAVNGGEAFEEQVLRTTAAGSPLATTLTRSTGFRVNDFRRYSNTIEADYQFSAAVGFHIGYRYSNRKVDVSGIDNTLTSTNTNPSFICQVRGTTNLNPRRLCEEEKNSTNTLIAGMKIRPVKNWVVYWDIEHGSADNVFTRLENYKFTNFRVRSRITLDKFVVNLSAFSKDNTNPSKSDELVPLDFGTVVKHRYYAGNLEWNPISKLSVSTGYTYHHLNSSAAIRIFVPTSTFGSSHYYMRDHYGYFDVSARPVDRLSLYASYRISRDFGQGDRVWVFAHRIVTAYPMQFQSPEFKAVFRLTRNVDWNVGYQYFDFKDSQTPLQNYRAHLPFTSLRIYFGTDGSSR